MVIGKLLFMTARCSRLKKESFVSRENALTLNPYVLWILSKEFDSLVSFIMDTENCFHLGPKFELDQILVGAGEEITSVAY